MSSPEQSSEKLSLSEQLKNLGIILGEDGILRGKLVENCKVGLPDQNGIVVIESPDGRTYTIEGVKGVQIEEISVRGKGNVGIVI